MSTRFKGELSGREVQIISAILDLATIAAGAPMIAVKVAAGGGGGLTAEEREEAEATARQFVKDHFPDLEVEAGGPMVRLTGGPEEE